MIRVGVAGMGYGANVHLPAFVEHPDVVVAALADGGSGRASQIAQQMGLSARCFTCGDGLVTWDGVDAVCIATPARHQSRLVRAALASGKHVLCEKPFGSALDDIAGLGHLAKGKGLTTALGYEFRYDQDIRQVIDWVHAGRVGRVSRIEVTWLVATGLNPSRTWSWRHDAESAGGLLIDWCCHVIDYVSVMLAEPIRDLWCSTSIRVCRRPDAEGVPKTVTAPDSCDVHCAFQGGAVGRFSVSNVEAAGIGHRVEVYGELGRIRFHHAPPFTQATRELVLQPTEGVQTVMSHSAEHGSGDRRGTAFSALADDFISAASGKGRPPLLPSFDDGERVWRALEAARQSDVEGRVVRVQH